MLNRWSLSKYPFGVWRGSIAISLENQSRMLPLLIDMLKAGEETDILRVAQTDATKTYNRTAIFENYVHHVREHFAENDKSPINLRKILSPTPPVFETRLSYFSLEDQIEESYVGDIDLLMRKLHPDIFEDDGWSAKIEPVNITGAYYEKSFYVTIGLAPDIWFPWISGRLDDLFYHHYYAPLNDENVDEEESGLTYIDDEGYLNLVDPLAPKVDGWVDNRALASRHTPRLNTFIERVRDLFLARGGEWEYETEMYTYKDMVTETGIDLDIHPKDFSKG